MKLQSKLVLCATLVGIAAMVGWKMIEPQISLGRQSSVSDAANKGQITIGMDSWVGYFPLCSPIMKKNLHREGYGMNCIDDTANYSERFKKLKKGELDFAVATVDSYILNGEPLNYPGPIIAVIDESKGGDAIVANKATVSNLEALKQASGLRYTWTPDSPSAHLAKSMVSHFDVPLFRDKSLYLTANGSEDAFKQLKSGQADIAVLWEPEVSKAVSDERFVRILGTEDTQQLIVDILLASKGNAAKEPRKVKSVLKAYFKTLKYYRGNPDVLIKDLQQEYRVSTKVADALVQGAQWASLSDNAERWFGVSQNSFSVDALVSTIDGAVDVLMDHGDFKRSPIPREDPYQLLNSQFITDLYNQYAYVGGFKAPGVNAGSSQVTFTALSDNKWQALSEVGSLKARKVGFSSGNDALTLDGKGEIDNLIGDLSHYPNYRIEIRGHTGTRGDKQANFALSQDRADAVLRYISIAHDFDKNRYRAVGFGGSRPLSKKASESNRAFNYRLPRVEIALVREEL